VLLALPQLYGVGYSVMYQAVGGGHVLWFLILLAAGKMIATSLTIGIGGSGGVFAPSLFIGATSGMAFAEIAGRLLGPGAGQPALYAVVAMGAVFTAAARAPLTSLASVVEMTGDFALTLPVMLAVAISTAISRALSYGTIYTTKLLRRGTDIDQSPPAHAFGDLTVAHAMRAFPVALTAEPDLHGPAAPQVPDRHRCRERCSAGPIPRCCSPTNPWPRPCASSRSTAETDCRCCRPTDSNCKAGSPAPACCERWRASSAPPGPGLLKLSSLPTGPSPTRRKPSTMPPAPLRGYQLLEITITDDSPAAGQALGDAAWPHGSVPVSILRNRILRDTEPRMILAAGDRVRLLVPATPRPGHEADSLPGGHRPDRPSRQGDRSCP
jgi:chloride channel protein, CIC family